MTSFQARSVVVLGLALDSSPSAQPSHPHTLVLPPPMAASTSDRRLSQIPVAISSLPRNVANYDLASQAATPVRHPNPRQPSVSPTPSTSSISPTQHQRPEHYAKLGLTRLPVSVVSESHTYPDAGRSSDRSRCARAHTVVPCSRSPRQVKVAPSAVSPHPTSSHHHDSQRLASCVTLC